MLVYASAEGSLSGETKEYQERPVEPNKIGVFKPPESITQIRTRHGRYLVDHDLAWLLNPCHRRRLDSDPAQWRLNLVGGQRTNRDGSGDIETIILHDDHRSWLTGVGASRSSDIDIASAHSTGSAPSSQSTEMASTNA